MTVPDANRQAVALGFSMQAPLELFGARLTEIAPGSVTISFDPTEELTTKGTGVVVGGVIATIADVAAGLSLVTLLDPPGPIMTLQMNSHFLRPAKGGPIRAVGRVEKIGRGQATVAADVFCDASQGPQKVAVLTAQFQIL
jgi:uncharacterized protein (TIGR00369 family)